MMYMAGNRLLFEDQVSPRAQLGSFYLFRNPHKAKDDRGQGFLEGLRQNLQRTLAAHTKFCNKVETTENGEIWMVWAGDKPNDVFVSLSERTVDEVLSIVEQPAAAKNLELPEPRDSLRVDAIELKDGWCVAFRAHHSIADGGVLKMIAQGVAEGIVPPIQYGYDKHSYYKEADEPEMKRSLDNSYFFLGDLGGPSQPAQPSRDYQTPTVSKTFCISRAKFKEHLNSGRPKWMSDYDLKKGSGSKNESVSRSEFGSPEFRSLATEIGAHVLAARIEAEGPEIAESAKHGNTEATIWIPVDVRNIYKLGIVDLGNAVVHAPVKVRVSDIFDVIDGEQGKKAQNAASAMFSAITNELTCVRSVEYLRKRKEFINRLVGQDYRNLGIRYDAGDPFWIHINDRRKGGADTKFSWYKNAEAAKRAAEDASKKGTDASKKPTCRKKADIVRVHVPKAPGIRFHPTRKSAGTYVLSITLPQKAMDILNLRPQFGMLMDKIKADERPGEESDEDSDE